MGAAPGHFSLGNRRATGFAGFVLTPIYRKMMLIAAAGAVAVAVIAKGCAAVVYTLFNYGVDRLVKLGCLAAVQAGGTGTFRVEAEGPAPLSYRWQLRTSAVGTWSDIEGAQSDSYTTSAVKKSNNGYQYRVAVTDGMGGSVTSDIATLTVTEAPATGDASHPVLYALMAVLLAGLALMLLKRRTA